MLGVVKLFPLAIGPPPTKVVYQKTVPAEAVAPNTKVPVPVLFPGVVLVIVGVVFTVIVTVFDVDGEPIKQGVALEVKIQITWSPLVNVVEE